MREGCRHPTSTSTITVTSMVEESPSFSHVVRCGRRRRSSIWGSLLPGISWQTRCSRAMHWRADLHPCSPSWPTPVCGAGLCTCFGDKGISSNRLSPPGPRAEATSSRITRGKAAPPLRIPAEIGGFRGSGCLPRVRRSPGVSRFTGASLWLCRLLDPLLGPDRGRTRCGAPAGSVGYASRKPGARFAHGSGAADALGYRFHRSDRHIADGSCGDGGAELMRLAIGLQHTGPGPLTEGARPVARGPEGFTARAAITGPRTCGRAEVPAFVGLTVRRRLSCASRRTGLRPHGNTRRKLFRPGSPPIWIAPEPGLLLRRNRGRTPRRTLFP